MKLTKSKLKQIIKEELENLPEIFQSTLPGVYNALKKRKKEREKREKARRAQRDRLKKDKTSKAAGKRDVDPYERPMEAGLAEKKGQ